jgi:hypothetical protein
MLCITGDVFVNVIVTLPALALNELWVNLNAPVGSAEFDTDELAAAGADVADADVDALDAGAELLLLEPPQAATPRASAALSAMIRDLDMGHLLSLGGGRR